MAPGAKRESNLRRPVPDPREIRIGARRASHRGAASAGKAIDLGLLASGGHEPHMVNMNSRENPQNGPSHYAAAILRWEDEGGAPASYPNKEQSKIDRSKRLAVVTTSLKVDQSLAELDQSLAEEEYILDYLGAAVMMRWATLPVKIQRELFEYATSLAGSAAHGATGGCHGRQPFSAGAGGS